MSKLPITYYQLRGYTLLELVVAVGVLGVLAVSAAVLFFSSVRGGSKVEVVTEVKQNGQYALNTMEQLIRNSLRVNGCFAAASSSVSLTARDGQALTFACVEVAEGTGYIASNSDRLTAKSVVVAECEFSCSQDPDKLRGELVTIKFKLRQAKGEAEAEEAATVEFNTSVALRSY